MRSRALLVICSFVLALGGCASPAARMPPPEPGEVDIVATSDFHATLDRAEGMASVIRALRQRFGEHMLLLDGGDLFQGSLEGNMSKGRSIIEFYNLLKVDAAALGNHDLDYGPDLPGRTNVKPGEDGLGNLRAREKEAKFAWLSANFVLQCTGTPVMKPHAVFERPAWNGKVCVIGATTPTTQYITNPDFIRGYRFLELAPAIETKARDLRKSERCGRVILVTHAGLVCSPELRPGEDVTAIRPGRCLKDGDKAEILALLKRLPRGTLDAVVAGHTHQVGQEVIEGVPVIEAGSNARAVGVLRLFDERVSFEPFRSVPESAEEPDVTAALRPYREAATSLKARPVGKAAAAFPRTYTAENPLINLVADAMLAATRELGARFALINAGGLRGSLPSGSLTYGDVFGALPFDNSLAVADLTGRQLRRILEIAFSGAHGVPGVSGLRIRKKNMPTTGSADWKRKLILDIRDESGHPLEDSRRYKLATVDYLTRGGDHEAVVYDRVPAARKRVLEGLWERDVVVDFIKKAGELSPASFFDPLRPRIELVPPVTGR